MSYGRITAGRRLSQCASSRSLPRPSLAVTPPLPRRQEIEGKRGGGGSSRLTFSTSSVVQQVAEPSDAPRGRLPPLARIDESLYSAVRPQPLSALSALASRLRLIPLEADDATRKRRLELLVQACTHPSFGNMVQKAQEQHGDDFMELLRVEKGNTTPSEGESTGKAEGASEGGEAQEEEAVEKKTPFERQLVAYPANLDNASLSTVGNSLLGMIAAEHLHLRFPNLPTRVLKAAVSAHVGPNTLADVATELGLGGQGIMRWDRKARTAAVQEDENGKRFMVIEKQQKLMSRDVMAEAMRSIVAVIFQEQGLEMARSFVRNHFLTRLVPLAPLLKFSDPKKTLSETCKKYARERPQSRLIAETGRLSINPIFVVGVWSGQDKLGEGTGSRIKMAEYRAAEDALRRFYLSETPAHELLLPSQTLDREFSSPLGIDKRGASKDVWKFGQPTAAASEEPFRPSRIGHSEVVFGSRG